MKKWMFGLILAILACIIFPTHNAVAEEPLPIRSITKEVNLLADDYATIITTIPENATVIMYEKSNGWAKIGFMQYTGFVKLNVLKSIKPEPMLASSKNPPYVRETNNFHAKPLGNVYVDSIVQVYATDEQGWSFVQYGNLTGYVIATALKTPKTKTMVVKEPKGLSVKLTASTSSSEIAVLQDKTKVEVYTLLQGWAYIVAGDIQGYVVASKLQNTTIPKIGKFNYGVVTKTKRVALTFDDGPHPTITHQILKTLEKYDAKATFFVTGHRVEKSPDVLKDVFEAGHEIGNHTYNHPKLTDLPMKQVKSQIEQTNKLVKSIIGEEPTLFRPPYGSFDKEIQASLSVPLIMWSVDTLDWKHREPAKTLDAVQNYSKNGSIILMHDVHQTTADALDQVLAYLTKQGYEFVTVSEILN
ncbi:polysaccharide deacetylase family protein [Solibacillus sp. CAU 1738]|uniref:polysaccharide deacetylase family protein n=1 Tax=Solibacillus sp. CAU 1738 TaxID=3140363 RepID=UPI0032612343